MRVSKYKIELEVEHEHGLAINLQLDRSTISISGGSARKDANPGVEEDNMAGTEEEHDRVSLTDPQEKREEEARDEDVAPAEDLRPILQGENLTKWEGYSSFAENLIVTGAKLSDALRNDQNNVKKLYTFHNDQSDDVVTERLPEETSLKREKLRHFHKKFDVLKNNLRDFAEAQIEVFQKMMEVLEHHEMRSNHEVEAALAEEDDVFLDLAIQRQVQNVRYLSDFEDNLCVRRNRDA
ncbi:unnamed protein product [Caenorhabditis auriculariae]|uniref:Uncharacterized protein n=1 Tax=Caenorhabditis auriculariae TaxID=2777116 RepID=A0A8S1H8Q3_9PELO|nr:unnamed protein product [Caenorhabditis auriculariae]